MDLKANLTRALFRGLRAADAPGMVEHFRFQDLL
jgi:hypothetical protein